MKMDRPCRYLWITHVLVCASNHHVRALLWAQKPQELLHIVSVYPLLTAPRVPDAQVSRSLSSSFDGLGLYSPLHVCLSAIWCSGTRKGLETPCYACHMWRKPHKGPIKDNLSSFFRLIKHSKKSFIYNCMSTKLKVYPKVTETENCFSTGIWMMKCGAGGSVHIIFTALTHFLCS